MTVCTSNVRVHEEIREYGGVVDPGCMKCLDCVSVCPNDALSYNCGSTSDHHCLRQHNGSVLLLYTKSTCSFGGTTNNYLLWFMVDPDGKQTTRQDSIWFALYFNGRLSTWGQAAPNSYDCGGAGAPFAGNPIYNPAWFSWN